MRRSPINSSLRLTLEYLAEDLEIVFSDTIYDESPLEGDTWIYVDAPLKQPKQDEYEYECYIKPYETHIPMWKDILIKHSPILEKLFSPTMQYRFLQHRDLVNKLPSNVKYVVDLTLPIDGEGACLLTACKSSVAKHIGSMIRFLHLKLIS